jgi:multicomponent Na+:H+ antiporter subunit D
MPLTATFCIVGAVSISGFPLFSGFVTKSMVLSAAGEMHLPLVMLGLIFASAGVMEHSGIKIPFFAFFAHDSGIRCKEAPLNMLVGMGGAALLCLLIGLFPGPLYGLLPFPVDYHPYTAGHVITQFQLLLWATLAFCVLFRTHLYPREVPSVNLDFDWIYRRLLPGAIRGLYGRGVSLRAHLVGRTLARLDSLMKGVYRYHGPAGIFARTWMTGSAVVWVVVLLLVVLAIYYF